MKRLAGGSLFVLFALVAGTGAAPYAAADHGQAMVEIPAGTNVKGCEETNECYIPAEITVDVGGEVIWTNVDTAAHTVTAGSSADGPTGEFDSSLVLAGEEFKHTFEEAGTIPYFCIVHPWMEGVVTVSAEEPAGDMMMMESSATAMLSDGTPIMIESGVPTAGEMLEIMVTFEDSEHVNYAVTVMQDGNMVLDDSGAHSHDGTMMHATSPLESDSPVDISITFDGFGLPGEAMTGPAGEEITFTNIVPEFGTVAVLVLTVAIVSIIAITARSRLGMVPRI